MSSETSSDSENPEGKFEDKLPPNRREKLFIDIDLDR